MSSLLSEAQARAFGNSLLQRIRGGGWKLEVWNTWTWHYVIKKDVEGGMLSVRPSSVYPDKFICHLTNSKYLDVPHYWADNRAFVDPNDAVRAQLEKAREFLNKITTVVTSAERALDVEETFIDLDPETMTCRLCGERWGESHDMPGKCYVWNRDGTRTGVTISGRIPPFQGQPEA